MKDPSIEKQIEQLLQAGWTRVRFDLWRSPKGNLYRGPHGAWLVMNHCYDCDTTCFCNHQSVHKVTAKQ